MSSPQTHSYRIIQDVLRTNSRTVQGTRTAAGDQGCDPERDDVRSSAVQASEHSPSPFLELGWKLAEVALEEKLHVSTALALGLSQDSNRGSGGAARKTNTAVVL